MATVLTVISDFNHVLESLNICEKLNTSQTQVCSACTRVTMVVGITVNVVPETDFY